MSLYFYYIELEKVRAVTVEITGMNFFIFAVDLQCEKDTRVFSELMDKVKEVLLVSNLTKATEMALQLSSKVLGGFASPDAVVEPGTIGVKRNREKVAKKVRS